MDLCDQKFFINKVPASRLTNVQISKMWDLFPNELKLFINMALQNQIIFVISGSFASYSINILDQYSDFDIFINGTLECLPDFWPFKDRLRQDRKIYETYKERIDRVARRNRYKVRKVAISCVLPVRGHYDDDSDYKITYPKIDFVLAPLEKCTIPKLYGLYVIKTFDIAPTRVCIFHPYFDEPRIMEYLSLQMPSFKYLDNIRRKKYEKRKFVVQPSSLSLLSLNTLIDSKQISCQN